MSKSDLQNALKVVLADTFVLYFKTHAFHWNVTGPRFTQLHNLFEEQYTEIWQASDEIAERIRTIGDFTGNNPQEIMKGATLEHVSQTPDANEMVKMLANDNREIVKSLQKAASAAVDNDDAATEDLMVERMRIHEKAAWMLESTIDKAA
ncbi:MAG: DNA starvation/stationary phase protection protein [Alphaproteobacteria bacterium]|nr:DNA starvation/stationary phase protection protein [Alphaproteobacteria bacterium]